ncbi:hypothetical protein VII00023_16175 [Vibrio ichthyoenteri ATCC 700023]|uniref:DUF4381 domain-containing protein n=1 Tax=Vibrio ichthyoenteri ATCC 700023 TaxID=870968 RepID=F9S0B5_9VIBR|nr:DUF4381 domain-containing protein [Vibrio ichthyoenteri]EGU43385.1 hypothetical protein VII00023_16175 [Vibrio ichthyoenteri ATCC 700023]
MSDPHTPPSTYILRNLHDVTVPESVSWLPQTLGWKILFATGVIAGLYFLWRTARWWWRNRYRKEALIALERVSIANPQAGHQIYAILKIVLNHLSRHYRQQFGLPLLKSLDDLSPIDARFASKLGKKWLHSLVDPKTQLTEKERATLLNDASEWLKRHHNQGQLTKKSSTTQRRKIPRGKDD